MELKILGINFLDDLLYLFLKYFINCKAHTLQGLLHKHYHDLFFNQILKFKDMLNI